MAEACPHSSFGRNICKFTFLKTYSMKSMKITIITIFDIIKIIDEFNKL